MSVSLNNKRNTRIVDNDETVKLIHHGSNTCTFYKLSRLCDISLCGYDTVTTRGKLNAFFREYGLQFSIYRNKGATFIRDRVSGYETEMRSREHIVLRG